MLLAAREARRWFLEAGRTADAAEMLTAVANGDRRTACRSSERRATIDQGLAELEARRARPTARDVARPRWSASRRSTSSTRRTSTRRDRLNAAYHELAGTLGDHESTLEAEFFAAQIALVRSRGPRHRSSGWSQIAREAREAGYESVGVTSFRVTATMAARVMEYPAAEAAIAEGLEYADAIEQSHCRQQMATTSALIAWAHGDWDDAHRAPPARSSSSVAAGAASLGAVPVIGLRRPRARRARRGPTLARRGADRGRAVRRRRDDPAAALGARGARRSSPATRRPPPSAAPEALAIAERTGERPFFVPFVVTGTRALLAAHRPDDAERWVGRDRAHLAGWAMADAALAHAEGLVRLSAGHADGGPRGARGGRRAAGTRRGRIWEATWARLDLAHCLLRSNRYAEAAALIAAVRETADVARQPRRCSRAPMSSPGSGAGAGTVEEPWHPLTAREFEVARLIAEGMTNAEIADAARHRAEDGELARRAHPREARRDPPGRDRRLDGERSRGRPRRRPGRRRAAPRSRPAARTRRPSGRAASRRTAAITNGRRRRCPASTGPPPESTRSQTSIGSS